MIGWSTYLCKHGPCAENIRRYTGLHMDGRFFRAKQSSQYECLADKRKELQGKRTRAHGQYNHKQFSCKRFKRGECDLGDGCKYSHESDTKYERVEENSDILTPNDDEPMKT